MREEINTQIDLSKILGPYSDKWVALSFDGKEIIASGETVKETLEKAKEKGEKSPILTKVPKEYGNYVL